MLNLKFYKLDPHFERAAIGVVEEGRASAKIIADKLDLSLQTSNELLSMLGEYGVISKDQTGGYNELLIKSIPDVQRLVNQLTSTTRNLIFDWDDICIYLYEIEHVGGPQVNDGYFELKFRLNNNRRSKTRIYHVGMKYHSAVYGDIQGKCYDTNSFDAIDVGSNESCTFDIRVHLIEPRIDDTIDLKLGISPENEFARGYDISYRLLYLGQGWSIEMHSAGRTDFIWNLRRTLVTDIPVQDTRNIPQELFKLTSYRELYPDGTYVEDWEHREEIVKGIPIKFDKEENVDEDVTRVELFEPKIITHKVVKYDPQNNSIDEPSSTSNSLFELEKLIGLSSVKDEVKGIYNFIRAQKMRQDRGLKIAPISYHCIFTGNPGTGKTTVARILAGVYRDLGILQKGHLVETDRSGLVAEYVGQTAIKTNKIIDRAIGGCLFIDEAYSLISGSESDFGHEAIATLLKRMEDSRGNLIVILAGYSEEMECFINSNPGLQSRFRKTIEFPDYTKDELILILQKFLDDFQYKLDDGAKDKISEIFSETLLSADKKFGNGRFVRNFFESTIQRQANRIAQIIEPSKLDLELIKACDCLGM